MSGPYDQNPAQPGNPADPAAPTQFVPVQGQQPAQPQFGQAPQFGAPAPQQPQDAPAWGQAQAPQFGAQPTQPYPNANANPNANPYPAGNPYQQYPAQPAKKQRGRGAAGILAFALGTALGRLVLLLLIGGGIAAYHFATADPAQRNSSGQVSQSGSLQATDLHVGDCFDAPTGTSSISSVKAIPCAQAHDSQVYAEPAISESSFPGVSTLQTEGQTACNADSATSAVSSSAPSTLQGQIYYPQDDSTFAEQKYFICSITSSSANLSQSYVTSAG